MRQRVKAASTAALAASAALAMVWATSAGARVPPRWVLVGRERFSVNGRFATVPTYVNTNSIEGDRFDSFTVTFQARYNGRQGIDRVNVGAIVDCQQETVSAEQFYVYYGAGSTDFDRTDGGELSARVTNRALSYCR